MESLSSASAPAACVRGSAGEVGDRDRGPGSAATHSSRHGVCGQAAHVLDAYGGACSAALRNACNAVRLHMQRALCSAPASCRQTRSPPLTLSAAPVRSHRAKTRSRASLHLAVASTHWLREGGGGGEEEAGTALTTRYQAVRWTPRCCSRPSSSSTRCAAFNRGGMPVVVGAHVVAPTACGRVSMGLSSHGNGRMTEPSSRHMSIALREALGAAIPFPAPRVARWSETLNSRSRR
jgi:hypothetical protein